MRTISVWVLALAFGVAFWNSESLGAAASGSTQTASSGGVTAKVTYQAQTDHESKFSVVLDTHSVNLDTYDLKVLSVLRDDTGLTMAPTRAENKASGHHREILLTFPRPSLERKWLELVIKDVAGVKERVFRWKRE